MGVASSTTNANRIKGKVVDDSAIGDGKVLTYNATTGKLEYTDNTPSDVTADIAYIESQLQNGGLTSGVESGCVAYFNDLGLLDNSGVPLTAFMLHADAPTAGNVAILTAGGAVEDAGVALEDIVVDSDLSAYLPLTGGTLTAAPETEVLFITDTDGRSMSLRPTHIESAEPITLNNLKFTKGDGTYASINDDAITGQVLLKVDYSTGWTHYGNDAIRATSDGNVLVGSAGTDDEANVLQVSGSGKFTGDLVVEGTTTLGAAVIYAATTTTVTAEESVLVANQVFIDTYGILTQGGDILMNDGGGTGGGDLQMDSGDVRSVGYLEVLGTTSLSGALTGTTAAFSGLVEAGSATLSGALAGTSATFSGNVTSAKYVGPYSATQGVVYGYNTFSWIDVGSTTRMSFNATSAGALCLHNDNHIKWSSNVANQSAANTTIGLYRSADGVLKVTDGYTGFGSLSALNLTLSGDLSVGDDLTVTGDLGVTGPITGTTATFSGAVTLTHAAAYIKGSADGRIGIRGEPDSAGSVKNKLHGLTQCAEGWLTDGSFGAYGANNYFKPFNNGTGNLEVNSTLYGLSFQTAGVERLAIANGGTVSVATDLSVGDDLTVVGDLGVTGPITGTTASLTGLLTLGSGGASGSGNQNYVYFNNSTGQNPTIKWNPVSAATGLRFFSNTTEVARFQDNGSCYFSSFGTLAGLNIGDYHIARGTPDNGPTFRMRQAGDTALGLHSFTATGTTLGVNDLYFGIIAPTNNATSGTNVGTKIATTYNQASGTAANTDLLINRTQTAVGSGTQRLIDAQVGGVSKFSVSNNGSAAFASIVSSPTLETDSLTVYDILTGFYATFGDGVHTDGTFTGSGAGLTSIPQSAVTSLTSDLAAKIGGSGSTGRLPKFTASGTVGDSHISQDANNIYADKPTIAQVGGDGVGLTLNNSTNAYCSLSLTNGTKTWQFSHRPTSGENSNFSFYHWNGASWANAAAFSPSGDLTLLGGITAPAGTSIVNYLTTYGDINCDTDIYCTGTMVPSGGIYSFGEITVDGAGIFTTAQSTFGSVKLTPVSTAPTATKGGMYFDSDVDKFYVCKNGTTWVEMTTA